MLRILLELLRVMLIIGIFGGIGWQILWQLYTANEVPERYTWLGGIAVIILIFVLYRNKLQFSGWYKGSGKVKLSKFASVSLLISSVILILLPFIMRFLIDG